MNNILFALDPNIINENMLTPVRSIISDMKIMVTTDRQEIERELGVLEIVVGRFPFDLVSKAKNLRWFQQWDAGAEWLMRYPELIHLDFDLTSASGIHTIPASEHVLAFMLIFSRRLNSAIRSQIQLEWNFAERDHVFELDGKTLLLIGVGSIGNQVAHTAAALGMRVLGVRRNSESNVPDVDVMFGPEQLLSVLPKADFVVLKIPLTYETQGIIGELELRAMKPTSILINIGRGGTIQEAALIRALREGWIAGAGLDVFENEPLTSKSPFWNMNNVVITAHYSGITPHYHDYAMNIFLNNLKRYKSGLPLLNLVNKELGY